VTFQVRQLEEHFNTRLFDRSQGRTSLTAAGAIAFEYAERILALSAELDTRLKEMGGSSRPMCALRWTTWPTTWKGSTAIRSKIACELDFEGRAGPRHEGRPDLLPADP
jgi:hypothetical protein